MNTRWRALLPSIITLGAVVGLLVYGPIPQLPNYHAFADRREVFGIPHWGDVISNAGFAFVGIWGLRVLVTSRRIAPERAGSLGYGVFFISLLLTAFGSSFYHWAPDNDRLVWDRLPIALACAGLLAAVRAESKRSTNEVAWTTALALVAVSSVFWWQVTETVGQGDLRPYLLLQGLPLVLIPLWQANAGASRTTRAAFGAAVLLYVVAKVAELSDHAIYAQLGLISGHTIKHVLATISAAILVAQLAWRPRWSSAETHRNSASSDTLLTCPPF
jgi:hypothetical protein